MQPCCSKKLINNQGRERQIKELIVTLGFSFKNPNWLEQALVHSSFANENPDLGLSSNERLEFLGDAVLDLIVSELLFQRYPQWDEGFLSRARSSLVRERSLAIVARRIDLGRFLLLGCGEQSKDGKITESVLADAFEALVGAVYLDSGFDFTAEWLEKQFEDPLEHVEECLPQEDFKTRLQEILQQQGPREICYTLISELGPAHAKNFVMAVRVEGKLLGKGCGKSKKLAEQEAAREALAVLASQPIIPV